MRIFAYVAAGAILLASGVHDVSAQSTVLPGAPVGGGGSSASASLSVRGTLGGAPAGVVRSASYIASGGVIASLPYGPVFTVQPMGANPPAGAPIIVTAGVISGTGVTMATYYRTGGQSGYESAAMSSGDGVTFTGTIPAAAVGVRGVEYFVAAMNARGTSTQPPYGASAPYTVDVVLVEMKAPALPDAYYRMLGFPFVVSPATVADVFQDDLGDPDTSLWRLGRWDQTLNSGAGGYLEFAGVGPVKRGNGYWLIARGGKSVDASGVSARPDTVFGDTRYATLTLEPGWNQIATPFAFHMDWSARLEQEPTAIEDALWAYTATGYQDTTILEPFQGYWVRNAGTVSHLLWLPYREYAPARRPLKQADTFTPDNWRMELKLTSGSLVDRAQTIGVDAAARDDYDPLDCCRPPAPDGEFLSVVSLAAGASGDILPLAKDLRAPGTRGVRFQLLIRGSTAGPGKLSAIGAAGLPGGYAVALVDVAGARTYSLPAPGTLTLPRTLTTEGSRYDLLVGTSEWIIDQGGEPETMPDLVTMRQNCPNPFNPQTSISFALPAPALVRLTIFNVAGRRIEVLLDQDMTAGNHTVTWNGRDAHGRAVASGKYFYRLEADGIAMTRSMTLIR